MLSLTQNKVFAVLSLNYAVFSISALEKGFRLFPADHAGSSYISLKTRFSFLLLNYAVFFFFFFLVANKREHVSGAMELKTGWFIENEAKTFVWVRQLQSTWLLVTGRKRFPDTKKKTTTKKQNRCFNEIKLE